MDRIAHLLGANEPWERPGPTAAQRRTDVWIALGWYVVAALAVELMRSMGAFHGSSSPGDVVAQQLWAASAAALLVWRRSYPMTVALAAVTHLYVAGSFEPGVAGNLPLQALYFFAVYTGVAWARDRRALVFVLVAILASLVLWLAWVFAISSGVAEIQRAIDVDLGSGVGLFSPAVATVGFTTLNNLMFFGGSTLLGQVAWRGALHTSRQLEQALTIQRQASRLRDQAVVAERLRIARELHDVVAHHVSVMGVQAAAARRVLSRDQAAAERALTAVEGASRSAVGQMRDLLGTLRAGEDAADGTPEPEGRSPQPDLESLPDLVAESSTPLVQTEYDLVEDPPGAAAQVPPALQLTAYRIVQESLANVHRHSTATRASVVVRVAGELEVEVLDNGAPRPGTRGTGLGQQGIRERATLLGGEVEIGPRHGGGYRVRVTLPVGVEQLVR